MKTTLTVISVLIILCQSINTYSQSYDFYNYDSGIKLKTGTSTQNWYENMDYFQLDNCGIKQKSSSLEITNLSDSYDLYNYDSYGMKQLSKSYEQNWIGGLDIYEYDKWGMKHNTGTIENNHLGGYDIYQYGDYGLKKRVGTIEKTLY